MVTAIYSIYCACSSVWFLLTHLPGFPYNNPVFLFPLWHHCRPLPSFPLPALTGNEPPQSFAINGGGGGAVTGQGHTCVLCIGPVFPLGLLLKWGTGLGHIKSLLKVSVVKTSTHRAPVVCFFCHAHSRLRTETRENIVSRTCSSRYLLQRLHKHVSEHFYFSHPSFWQELWISPVNIYLYFLEFIFLQWKRQRKMCLMFDLRLKMKRCPLPLCSNCGKESVLFICACVAGLPLFSAPNSSCRRPVCCCDCSNCVPCSCTAPCVTATPALWPRVDWVISHVNCLQITPEREMVVGEGGRPVIQTGNCVLNTHVWIACVCTTTNRPVLFLTLSLLQESICCENTHSHTFFFFHQGKGHMLRLNNSWFVERRRNSWGQREKPPRS